MRIFTKKSFEFRQGGDKVVTRLFDFTDVPEWVKKDPIFGWGLSDGDITITESAREESKAEKKAGK